MDSWETPYLEAVKEREVYTKKGICVHVFRQTPGGLHVMAPFILLHVSMIIVVHRMDLQGKNISIDTPT